jgi:hypothetical protein
MRDLLSVFFALIITNFSLSGQVAQLPPVQEGDLSLRIKSISFVKDNEYTTPTIEGYTLIGFFFHPELVYSPSTKVTLRAGIHILKYSGQTKFSMLRPVFSASLNLTKNTLLTIGTLSGSDNHQLFDPHFNSERLYNAYSEDGMQITSNNDHFFNDTWISWENFIVKNDTTREIFTFGESLKYKSTMVANFLQFEIPVQIQFKHYGGQISNYPEQVETFFNLATGLRANFNLDNKRYGQLGIEYLQFINNQLNGKSSSGIKNGYGNWIRLHYTYKSIYFGAAYWKSHDFYAPNGDDIYSSVSDYQVNVVLPQRKIITNSLYLALLPESYLGLFFGVDTYYDLNLRRLDYALTLHLNFDKLIKLAVLKR